MKTIKKKESINNVAGGISDSNIKEINFGGCGSTQYGCKEDGVSGRTEEEVK